MERFYNNILNEYTEFKNDCLFRDKEWLFDNSNKISFFRNLHDFFEFCFYDESSKSIYDISEINIFENTPNIIYNIFHYYINSSVGYDTCSYDCTYELLKDYMKYIKKGGL